MSDIDPGLAINRIKDGGRITGEELRFVKSHLRDPLADDDIGQLAYLLALSSLPNEENVALLEQHLNRSDDNYDLPAIVSALCGRWGLTSNYLEFLLEIVDYDRQDEECAAASFQGLNALGAYLEETQDPNVYRKVLELVDRHLANSNDAGSNEHLRWAYGALVTGVSGRRAAMFVSLGEFSREEIDRSVTDEARRRGLPRRTAKHRRQTQRARKRTR